MIACLWATIELLKKLSKINSIELGKNDENVYINSFEDQIGIFLLISKPLKNARPMVSKPHTFLSNQFILIFLANISKLFAIK